MSLELTQAAKDLLAARGFDPVLGARPLRRTVQREIEDVLAEKMLYGEVGPGQIVLVDVEGEEVRAQSFTFKGSPRGEMPDTRAGRGRRSVPPPEGPTTPRARSTCPAPRAPSSTRPLGRWAGSRVVRPFVPSALCVRAGRTGRRRSATTRPSAISEREARSRCGWVGPGGVEARPGDAASVSRSTASSRPRHCRSVPAQVCASRGGRRTPGARRRATRTGRRPGTPSHRGLAAVQTSAPSSITATAQVGGGRLRRRAAARSASVALGPGHRGARGTRRRPTARASTRRTLVSSTTCRRPKANDATARRGVVADARAARAGRRTTPAPRRRAARRSRVAAACRRSARRG